jgi:hypothetical protein
MTQQYLSGSGLAVDGEGESEQTSLQTKEPK